MEDLLEDSVNDEERDEVEEEQESRRSGNCHEERENEETHLVLPIKSGTIMKLAVTFSVPDPDHIFTREQLSRLVDGIALVAATAIYAGIVRVAIRDVVPADQLGEFVESHYATSFLRMTRLERINDIQAL
jgi:hypothetical protein